MEAFPDAFQAERGCALSCGNAHGNGRGLEGRTRGSSADVSIVQEVETAGIHEFALPDGARGRE